MTVSREPLGRLTFLDFLRGIAALAVCFEHAGYRLWPGFRDLTHTYFSFGKFGVATFFLTSGFVIPYSLENSNSVRRFWISRFFRLYPLYWFSIAVAVTFLSLGVAGAAEPNFAEHPVRNTLINLTMLQEYVHTPDAIGLYYTLAMEMAFYVVFCILFLRGLNKRSLSIAWLTSCVVAIFAVAIPLTIHRRVPLAGLFYVICLTVGTIFYRNFKCEASGKAVCLLSSFIALSTAVSIFCNYVLIKKTDPLEHYTMFAVFASWATAYLVFLSAYLLRRYAFPKVFVSLGLISYSVYLLHPPMQALIPIWANPIYSLLAMMALTLAVSFCTYRLIELPGIALGKTLYARFKAREVRPFDLPQYAAEGET